MDYDGDYAGEALLKKIENTGGQTNGKHKHVNIKNLLFISQF